MSPICRVQQAAREGRVDYSKIPGPINPADMFTKPVDEKTMLGHAARISQVSLTGRAKAAPLRREIKEIIEQEIGQGIEQDDDTTEQAAQNNQPAPPRTHQHRAAAGIGHPISPQPARHLQHPEYTGSALSKNR